MLPQETALQPQTPSAGVLDSRQRATLRLRVGKRFYARAKLDITPTIFLTIGAILLGSAVIVRAARR